MALALLGLLCPGSSFAQLNITVNGSLGDLDGDGDGGAGEAAVVQAAVGCWSARVLTNRNFTLTIAGGPLCGSTIGQGRVNSVDGANLPITGSLTMDNDSTNYFVDPTPLTSTEWLSDDPSSPWRLLGGPGGVDLYSTFSHETGHALAWLSAAGCGGSNPSYDGLLTPSPGSFVAGPACSPPFPTRGQPQLPGCVRLVGASYDVALRGDGLGGSGSCPCNELSHPGITGDLMLGFYTNSPRETQSIEDVDLFRVAYADTVNLPPLVNAGNDIVSECNATGGSDVTLDGTGSTDSENDALTFNWTCPGITLSTPGSAMASGFFPLDQTVACRLDATDLAACPPDADFVEVTVEDTTPPDITCPADQIVSCDASTDPADTGEALATDVCDAAPSILFSDEETPGDCPQEMTIDRTWEAIDGNGEASECTQTLSVVDVVAPEVSCEVAVDTLWPPNHKLVDVGLSFAVSDLCDEAPSVEIRVSSDESPDSELGAGGAKHCADAVIGGDGSVLLRAERSGLGDGRVYVITVEAVDGCGNSSSCEATVSVPKSQGPKGAAVSSGASFDATVCG